MSEFKELLTWHGATDRKTVLNGKCSNLKGGGGLLCAKVEEFRVQINDHGSHL